MKFQIISSKTHSSKISYEKYEGPVPQRGDSVVCDAETDFYFGRVAETEYSFTDTGLKQVRIWVAPICDNCDKGGY